MATIGNSLAPYFTATTSDVFSANGTGTDFTLTRSISNLVDIEVLVNNIQQNPFNGAYSVNGNTLTFSEAPSAGANNVLVSYRQAVIGSSIPTPNTVASSSLQRDLTLGGNTTSNGTMFTQALVPTANVTYDIGTSTLRYKDIYLSGTTIKLGDVSLSASGNTFTVANSTGGTLPSSMGNTTIAGTANVTGDMTIGGNLTVTGTMTYINTTDLNIGDAIISLNADLAANIAPTEDAGININRGASTNAQFKWIESTDNWSLGNTTVSGILTSNDHVITGTANVSTGINVGANVNLSTSQINVGNSTVNTVITSASLSTNSVTITGGAANSIAYLNASKVVTTGSALTFDGTHLGVGGLYSGYGANYPTIQAKGTYGGIFRSSDAAGNTVSLFYSSSGNYLTLGTETNYPIQFIVNNSERMRLDTSGNLGVGTTSPGVKLDVAGAIRSSVSGGTPIIYWNNGTTQHSISNIAGTMPFAIDGSEKMRLDSSGNLGIGTTTPGATLDLLSATNGMVARFKSSSNYGSVVADNSSNTGGGSFVARKNGTQYAIFGVSGAILGDTSTDVGILSDSAGGGIRFYTNGSPSEKARFDSSGNLGIGTSSPNRKLYVQSDDSSTGGNVVAVRNANTTAGAFINFLGGGGNAPSVGARNNDLVFTSDGYSGTEWMRIDSAGNVGVGTSSPGTKLHIVGNNTYDPLRLESTFSGYARSWTLGPNVGVSGFFVIRDTTAGANRLSIDSSGNMGIGTTTLTTSTGYTSLSINNANNSGYLVLQSNEVNKSDWYISGGTVANLRGVGVPLVLSATGANYLSLETNGSGRVRIDTNGNVGIGTTTPSTGKFSDAAYAFLIQSASTTNGTNIFASNSDNSKFVGFWSGHSSAEPAVGVKTGNALTFGKWGTINGTGGFTENLRITNTGNITIPYNGGILFAKSATAYANITELGYTAPIQVQETDTGTGSGRHIPIISGTSVSSSGYRQHTVFGSYRYTEWSAATIYVGGNDSYPTRAFYFYVNGNFSADGTIYGATKSFKISHPLPELEETHNLVHTSVESPQADLIYRGVVTLVDGTASVNIDTAAGMTNGTFEALCREVQCFTTNESDWTPVKGKVTGNILNIISQSDTAVSEISWLVIGERKDKFMLNTDTTDENGRVIVEPLKQEHELQPVTPENTINEQ